MRVKLIAHTQLSKEFAEELKERPSTHGQAVALTAIRTCYSHLPPSEILNSEYERYFGRKATDGLQGTEADRLIRHIVNSGHLSTLEHLAFTFAVEGVSRSLLAQLTRHRIGFSYSVQSQRYVKFGTGDRSGGTKVVVPPSIQNNPEALAVYEEFNQRMQQTYDELRRLGSTSRRRAVCSFERNHLQSRDDG